ncbi:hypothetical protein [Cellulomonas sp. ATA003]|uniref:hypothetical protein n=1 Tax=Cellulomonas sp. ATA003 TaxID=3073064 RepID=UPI0028736B43|nr:hypothetical protein [Cellulomonas sp. ATA003]WNB84506.1 hypothetical protein REH70_11730 [Cellulomonas sp. ATA003]
MAQIKVFGRSDVWAGRQAEVSDALQAALVAAWGLPPEKRFHRFLLSDADDVVVPGRGPARPPAGPSAGASATSSCSPTGSTSDISAVRPPGPHR